jgi:peptide/nickel transport system permease protein
MKSSTDGAMRFRDYMLRRLLGIFLVLIGVTLITFFTIHLVPSDPARLWAGSRATREQIEQARHQLGLDQPLYVQFGIYLNNLLHGDLGNSCHTRRAVILDIRDYFPATFELTTLAMIIAIVAGLPLGIVSAVKKNTWVDHSSRIFSLAGVSMPSFWFGLMLQLIFASTLHLLPASGIIDPFVQVHNPIQRITGLSMLDATITGNWVALSSVLQHMTLPALVLSYSSLVIITRMVRASMLEVVKQDYIRTARSKGLSERAVIYKHALKNALIPTTTVMGLSYGFMLGGSVLVEAVFDWPGIGLYATQSALIIDYPSILGVTLLFAIIYSVVNLVVDLFYGLIDPRIRYG